MSARPVRGRVIDAGGAPVAGARVTIVESPAPMPEMAMVTDEEGRFSLFLPAGRFLLHADGDEGASGTAVVEAGEKAGRDMLIRVEQKRS